MAVSRIGVIGIGNMGLPMALRLQNQGFAVTVFDNNAERAEQATRHRLRVAPSPAEAALHSRCTIVTVATTEQCEQVLFGPNGAVEALKTGDCVMLCTTQPAQAVEQQAQRMAARGVHCIDAPIAGGPDRAGHGTAVMLVACDNNTFDRHRPMIDVLSSRPLRVGTRPGLAAHAKVIDSLAAAVNLAGMAEAMAMAHRVGLDERLMIEVMESCGGQSSIGSDRFARAYRSEPQRLSGLDAMAREALYAMQAAHATGIKAPLVAAAAMQYQRACDAGLAGADDSALLRYVRDGGVEEVARVRIDTNTNTSADTSADTNMNTATDATDGRTKGDRA